MCWHKLTMSPPVQPRFDHHWLSHAYACMVARTASRRRHIRPQAPAVRASQRRRGSEQMSAPGNVRQCRPISFRDCQGYDFREFDISIVGLPVDYPDRDDYCHILQKGLRRKVRDLKAQILPYVLFSAAIRNILWYFYFNINSNWLFIHQLSLM
jgi:hypothetical protein